MTQERPDDLPKTPARTFPAGSPAPWVLSFIAALLLATCWFRSERLEDWSFHIDTRLGPQHAYFTDLELRSSRRVLDRADGKNTDGSRVNQCCEAISLTAERPEKLHLRWCDETTSLCRTEDVDFRGLLPYDIHFKTIYVAFVDGRMAIYLVGQELEFEPGQAPKWMYGDGYRYVLIYPPKSLRTPGMPESADRAVRMRRQEESR